MAEEIEMLPFSPGLSEENRQYGYFIQLPIFPQNIRMV